MPRIQMSFIKVIALIVALSFASLSQAATVLITDANSGIGLDLARPYAGEGVDSHGHPSSLRHAAKDTGKFLSYEGKPLPW
jgi:hypothetical protein